MLPARLADPPKNISPLLQFGAIELGVPSVMGVLNVTPDSFSDGGQFTDVANACRQAEAMQADGASIVDVGGESTRPGSKSVGADEELDRVIPTIEALKDATSLVISIDTSKAVVMRESVAAGAMMINDVMALRAPGAMTAAADTGVPVCLMHMRGEPRTMQSNPHYDDVTQDVLAFLSDRVKECVEAGVDRNNLIIDPGFGFGKNHGHNVELLANLRQLLDLEIPLLVGLSRKSTLGALTGKGVDDRLAGSLAAAVIAVMHGAHIIRAHDVRETVDALKVLSAVMEVKQ